MSERRGAHGRTLDIQELRRIVLQEYEVTGKRSTRRARAALDLHLVPYFERRRNATPSDYVEQRIREGAKPTTYRYELAILRRACNIAIRSGMMDRKPYIPSVKVDNARQVFFEPHELASLSRALPDPIDDMARFAAITGWRVSEVMGLTWSRVDRERETVRLYPGTTKNGEGRVFPYGQHPGLVGLLERRWKRRAGEYVFHARGLPVRDFSRRWIKACRICGLGDKVFHDLRRTALRNMERAGVPRAVQMKLVGLKTEAMHHRYAITNDEDLVRGVRILANHETPQENQHDNG